MRYRLLGKTGLYVSELTMGTMTFGGKGFWEAIGKLSSSQAETFIGTALDAGVNMIDTANVYSEGESEKYVGAALASLAGRGTRSLSRPRSGGGPARTRMKPACRANISWAPSMQA